MFPESLWKSEPDAKLENHAEVEPVEEHVAEVAEEPLQQEEEHLDQELEPEEGAPPVSLAVSADDFSALEERVLRAVEMLKHERMARAAAEVRIAEAEECAASAVAQLGPLQTQVNQQTPLIEQLQNEIFSLRAERDTVRHRVEHLLEQLETLEI